MCIRDRSKRNAAMMEFGRNIRGIIHDFDALPRKDVKKPRVGIVGEILVKFSPLANKMCIRDRFNIHQHKSHDIHHDDIIHQVANGVAAIFPFHFLKKFHLIILLFLIPAAQNQNKSFLLNMNATIRDSSRARTSTMPKP